MMSSLSDANIFWLEQLPRNLRPDEDKIEQLERLRSRAICHILPLPNNTFAEIILSSRWATRRVQESIYSMAKDRMPDVSEKELLEAVFRSRVYPRNPAGLVLTEEEIDKEMRCIESLNDLIQYFIQRDKEESRFSRDILGAGKRIATKVDKILES